MGLAWIILARRDTDGKKVYFITYLENKIKIKINKEMNKNTFPQLTDLFEGQTD